MAKFDVESKSGKIFDLQWRLTSLNSKNPKWLPKWHNFAQLKAFSLDILLSAYEIRGFQGQGSQI